MNKNAKLKGKVWLTDKSKRKQESTTALKGLIDKSTKALRWVCNISGNFQIGF